MTENYSHEIIVIDNDLAVIGTTDVMKWCDNHPNSKLDCTCFVCSKDELGIRNGLIVSDINKSDIESLLELDPIETWHEVFGWRRISGFDRCWFCYKDGRLLCITN